MSTSVTRIAVVTGWDTTSARSWSGVILPMVAALRAEFPQVDIIEAPSPTAASDRLRARLLGARGALHLPAWSSPTARLRSRAVAHDLARIPDDVAVVALAATPELLEVSPGRRILQVTDTSFAALVETYPAFSRVTPRGRRTAQRIEAAVADRTSGFLAATAWSRERLLEDVGVPAAAVTVARFGPAIAPTRDGRRPRPPEAGPLRLLLVATDWERKGGDLALAAVQKVRDRGREVELTVVGARGRSLPEHVTHYERLESAELSRLYATHHVLIEPSRASAGGVVVTDALHHGLPVLATAVGGLPDLVQDGGTGWLVLADADADALAEALIERVMAADLPAVSRAAGSWALREASWAGWAAAVREMIERPLRGRTD